jgi:GTP-binding protein Era
MRFFTSEMIREKVLTIYKQEIPYSTQVVVNSYLEEPDIVRSKRM